MKIRLTEGQMERLRAQMNEESTNTYNREVRVRISGYGATYQGKEIDDVVGGTHRQFWLLTRARSTTRQI